MPPVDVVRPEADPRSQSALPMDDTVLIVPDAIPYPGTSVEILEEAAADMRKAAGEISEGGSGIEASWQGLQAHYRAPEAEDLFSAMEPVRTRGETIHDDLVTVAGALETFAEAAAHAKKHLWRLREEARAFVAEVGDDPEWSGDLKLVTANRALIYAVNRAWGDFQEAERDCANSLENVTGSGNNYVAGSMTEAYEPKPGDIVYGIDPAEIPDVAYDLTEWEDWQRAFTDTWHFLGTGNHGWPMDWVVDASMAQWDYFGPGMVWDFGVGAVAATGLWREGRGWATSFEEVKTNFIDHKTETFQGYGAMAGLYGEDGWMNPFDADERSWETVRANAGPVWTEIAHDIVPWREWDDRPAYTVYTGAGNAVLTIVGLPVRGGMLAAKASQIASGMGRLLPDWDLSLASRLDFDLGRHLSDLRTGTATTLANLNGRLQELTSDLSLRIGFWDGGLGSPLFAGVPSGGGAWPLHTDGPEGATTAEAARRAENASESGGLRGITEELHRRQEPARAPDAGTADLPTDRRDPASDTTDPQESTSWRGDRTAAVDATHTPDDPSRSNDSAPDHDPARDRNDGPEDAERREPEFLQRSGGIVGNNNPRINLQEGDGFYDANGDLVEVGRRDHTGTYIDDEGNRYVDVPESAQALDRYKEIRADDGDVDRIAANTGFDRNVVDEIKQHIFFREHADIASLPDGRLRSGRFAPMDHIADLWRKAETGTLDASEANAFRRLVAHEYVEARLMQEGVPYRSRDPKLWHDDYYMPTRHNNGAHDLAPLNWKDEGFALWEKWGIPKPDPDRDFRLADDMSNLNVVTASALAWWKHQNPNGGLPFDKRPEGSAPGMAVDIDTDPGRSRNAPDPSIYENHPSTHIASDLVLENSRTETPESGAPNTVHADSGNTHEALPTTMEELETYKWGDTPEGRKRFYDHFESLVNGSDQFRSEFYHKNGYRRSIHVTIGPEKFQLPKLGWFDEESRWVVKDSLKAATPPFYKGDLSKAAALVIRLADTSIYRYLDSFSEVRRRAIDLDQKHLKDRLRLEARDKKIIKSGGALPQDLVKAQGDYKKYHRGMLEATD